MSAMSQENLSSGFPTWSDTNQAVQPQKVARGLKFRTDEVEGLCYLIYVEKTMALISCAPLFSHTCVCKKQVFSWYDMWTLNMVGKFALKFNLESSFLFQKDDKSP